MEYTPIENAIVAAMIAHYQDYLDEYRCQAAQLDSIFEHVFSQNAVYGCIIEYDTGQMGSESFSKGRWVWRFLGVFFIRYKDENQVEEDLRKILDLFPTLFESDRRLGGLTPRAWVTSVGTAEIAEVNDNPFYWLPFSISALAQ